MINSNFFQRFFFLLFLGLTMSALQSCSSDDNESNEVVSKGELGNTKWRVEVEAYYYDLDGIPTPSPGYGGNTETWTFYADGTARMNGGGIGGSSYHQTWKISGSKLLINYFYEGEPDGSDTFTIVENNKEGAWTIILKKKASKKEEYDDPDYRLYICTYIGEAE